MIFLAILLQEKQFIGGNFFFCRAQIYDIKSESWSRGATLPFRGNFGCLVSIGSNQLIYLGGGVDFNQSIMIYSDAQGWVTTNTTLPAPFTKSIVIKYPLKKIF